MKFKNRKLLFYMEVRYRLMKASKKRVNEMILKGLPLDHPDLIKRHVRYENHLINLYEKKEYFEAETGEKIVFY